VQRDSSERKFQVEPKWRGGPARLFALALPASMLCSIQRAEGQADAGLSIETGSPDALCPELGSTRAAVRRRLGELIMPGGSSGYRARYTIGHAPVGSPRDFVRLELFGPEGDLQLERDLPLEGESCSTMAEVIALVLDRYFRAVLAREPSGEVRAEGAAPERPGPAVSPAAPLPAEQPLGPATAPASVPAPPSASAPLASPALAGPRLRLAAFELAWGSPSAAALGVRALLEAWPQVYVGGALHVALLSETEDLAAGGEVSSREATLRAYVGWDPRLGSVRAYVGPGVCLDVARGERTDLANGTARYRAIWAAGLDAGALWVTDEGWSIGAAAALDVSFAELGGRFYADGREVLEPKTVRAWLGMSVGYAF
jgi:hypothetical protein